MEVAGIASVRINADLTGLQQGLAQARAMVSAFEQEAARGYSSVGAATRQFSNDVTGAAQRVAAANQTIAGSFTNIAMQVRNLAAAVGLGLGVREIVSLTNAVTDLRSRIQNLTRDTSETTATMDRLQTIARRTYSSFEQTAETFLRNNRVLSDLGYSMQQTLDFTEALNNALVVSGARGERAARVQNALTQAMSLGVLQGHNLQSVLESGDRVVSLIAESMGVASIELKRLGSEGKITAEIISRSLIGAMEQLRQEADAMPATVGDAFILIRNSWMQLLDRFEQGTGVFGGIAKLIISISDNLSKVTPVLGGLAGLIAGGPLGLVAGVGIGSWLGLVSASAEAANKRLEEHRKITEQIRTAYQSAAGDVRMWRDALEGLTLSDVTRNLDAQRRAYTSARGEISAAFAGTNLEFSGFDSVRSLVGQLQMADFLFQSNIINASDFKTRLEGIAEAANDFDNSDLFIGFVNNLIDMSTTAASAERVLIEAVQNVEPYYDDLSESTKAVVDQLREMFHIGPASADATASALGQLVGSMTLVEDAVSDLGEIGVVELTAMEQAIKLASDALTDLYGKIKNEDGSLGRAMPAGLLAGLETGDFSTIWDELTALSGTPAYAQLFKVFEGFIDARNRLIEQGERDVLELVQEYAEEGAATLRTAQEQALYEAQVYYDTIVSQLQEIVDQGGDVGNAFEIVQTAHEQMVASILNGEKQVVDALQAHLDALGRIGELAMTGRPQYAAYLEESTRAAAVNDLMNNRLPALLESLRALAGDVPPVEEAIDPLVQSNYDLKGSIDNLTSAITGAGGGSSRTKQMWSSGKDALQMAPWMPGDPLAPSPTDWAANQNLPTFEENLNAFVNEVVVGIFNGMVQAVADSLALPGIVSRLIRQGMEALTGRGFEPTSLEKFTDSIQSMVVEHFSSSWGAETAGALASQIVRFLPLALMSAPGHAGSAAATGVAQAGIEGLGAAAGVNPAVTYLLRTAAGQGVSYSYKDRVASEKQSQWGLIDPAKIDELIQATAAAAETFVRMEKVAVLRTGAAPGAAAFSFGDGGIGSLIAGVGTLTPEKMAGVVQSTAAAVGLAADLARIANIFDNTIVGGTLAPDMWMGRQGTAYANTPYKPAGWRPVQPSLVPTTQQWAMNRPGGSIAGPGGDEDFNAIYSKGAAVAAVAVDSAFDAMLQSGVDATAAVRAVLRTGTATPVPGISAGGSLIDRLMVGAGVLTANAIDEVIQATYAATVGLGIKTRTPVTPGTPAPLDSKLSARDATSAAWLANMAMLEANWPQQRGPSITGPGGDEDYQSIYGQSGVGVYDAGELEAVAEAMRTVAQVAPEAAAATADVADAVTVANDNAAALTTTLEESAPVEATDKATAKLSEAFIEARALVSDFAGTIQQELKDSTVPVQTLTERSTELVEQLALLGRANPGDNDLAQFLSDVTPGVNQLITDLYTLAAANNQAAGTTDTFGIALDALQMALDKGLNNKAVIESLYQIALVAATTSQQIMAVKTALAGGPPEGVTPADPKLNSGLKPSGIGGGGGGPSWSFDDALASITEQTRALEQEAATRGMATNEAKAYLMVQEQINAAADAGITVTDAQRLALEGAAEGWRIAADEADAYAKKVAEAEERFNNWKDAARDFLGTIIGSMRQGATFVEALGEAFGRLADRLIDMALNALINALFAKLAGAIGSDHPLLAAAFGVIAGVTPGTVGGGATGGLLSGPGTGTSDNLLIRASPGEFIVNAASTARNLPLLRAINDNSMPSFAYGGMVGHGGGGGAFIFAPVTHINAQGSNLTEAQIGRLLDIRDRKFRDMLPGALAKHATNRRF